MRVYLAGGLKSGWQESVKDMVPAVSFIDPRDSGLADPDQFTAWDLLGIRMADIVFAYLEEDNQNPLGMMLEIGYAKALGKTVVFAEDGDEESPPRRSVMVRSMADVSIVGLEEGCLVLRSFIHMDVERRAE